MTVAVDDRPGEWLLRRRTILVDHGCGNNRRDRWPSQWMTVVVMTVALMAVTMMLTWLWLLQLMNVAVMTVAVNDHQGNGRCRHDYGVERSIILRPVCNEILRFNFPPTPPYGYVDLIRQYPPPLPTLAWRLPWKYLTREGSYSPLWQSQITLRITNTLSKLCYRTSIIDSIRSNRNKEGIIVASPNPYNQVGLL